MGNKVVFSKFINIDLFVCESHLNMRIGGRPMLRDREMARAGPDGQGKGYGDGVGVVRSHD